MFAAPVCLTIIFSCRITAYSEFGLNVIRVCTGNDGEFIKSQLCIPFSEV